MLKKTYLFICFLLLVFLGACSEDTNITIPEEPADEFKITIRAFPDVGTVGTTFDFTVAIFKNDSLAENYKVKFDFDNNDEFETDWLDTLTHPYTYAGIGDKVIKVIASDETGNELIAYDTVLVKEVIQITDLEPSRSHGNLDWSRDGSNRIAFDGTSPGVFYRIFVADFPNKTPMQISVSDDSEIVHQFPDWSVDGSKLAYTVFENTQSNWIEIYDFNTQQNEKHFIYPHRQFIWHPDGEGLIIKKSGGKDLYYYNISAKTDSLIFEDADSYCINSDGTVIALARYADDSHTNGNISFYDYNSGAKIREQEVPAFGYKLDWAPNDELICLGVKNNTIYILNYFSGNIYSIKINGMESPWHPGWSEDNSMLAFEGRYLDAIRIHPLWAIQIGDEFK